ncbi:MAG: TIGR00725 family protein [Desulfohalobiaceae bacterium]|nr:TIGR00725 family protein [Desulfohalobiaceae bacterium]
MKSPNRPRISVVGSGRCSEDVSRQAEHLGRLLAGAGFAIVCGGLGGAMESVCKGAAAANGYSIGILPGTDYLEANQYCTHAVATGLGPMRNYLVILNGALTVAVAGGYGTLSEIGLAQKIGRPVIGLGAWPHIPGLIQAKDPEEVLGEIRRIL